MNPFGGMSANHRDTYPRILGVFTDFSASSYYRIQVVMEALHRLGYPTGWAHIDSIPDAIVQMYDMVITSRTGNGDPEAIRQGFGSIQQTKNDKGRNVKLIFDYDDDVLHVPDHNPGKPINTDGILVAMELADALTCTNETLAAVLRQHNKHVHVIPNMVLPDHWPARDHADDGEALVIGLVGSETHIEDWRIVAEPLHRIKEEYGSTIDIMTGGFLPPYLEDICTIHVPWGPIDAYPHMVNCIDIGLCPLVDDDFNRSKSPIKAYEYAQADAAVIGSPTQYRTTLQGRGMIAKTADDWYFALKRYIDDPSARQEHAKKLKQYVTKNIHAVEGMKTKYQNIYPKMFME